MSVHKGVNLQGLTPDQDIDLADIPNHVWEINIDTKSVGDSLRLSNVPPNLTSLSLGLSLSKSLTESFHLPATLVSYKGPMLSGMRCPDGLESLHVIETRASVSTPGIHLPSLRELVVENPLKFSGLDEIKLPDSIKSFRVIGKHNCSFERLIFPSSISSIDLGLSSQPTDLVKSPIPIETKKTKHVNREILEKKPLIIKSDEDSLQALHEYKPRIEKIHVVLDSVVSSIGDVWTEVLLEGRVNVRELTIINGTGNPCLKDCEDVFRRSKALNRKLCKKLIILCETFSDASHLNLARSLQGVGNLSIEISYMGNRRVSECNLPRLSNYFDLEKSHSGYSSNRFGVLSTTVRVTPENTLEITTGSSPVLYTPPTRTSKIVPLSSAEFIDQGFPVKPKERPITLHTWTKCGYCDKQQVFIDEFRNKSESNKNMFDDMVDTKKIENPEEIDDKRVTSFPTWVKNNDLIVGVQGLEQLTKLLTP